MKGLLGELWHVQIKEIYHRQWQPKALFAERRATIVQYLPQFEAESSVQHKHLIILQLAAMAYDFHSTIRSSVIGTGDSTEYGIRQ